MKVFELFHLLALLAFGLAAITTTTTSSSSSTSTTILVEPTIVYVTVVKNGILTTMPSTWSSTPPVTLADGTASVPSGSIGLGSLSGTVGGVRTYDQKTENNAIVVIYSSVFSLFMLLLNWVF